MNTPEPRLLRVEVAGDLPVLWSLFRRLDLPATVDRHFPVPRPETYHPVVCHLLDVGSVAHELWTYGIRPQVKHSVADRLGSSENGAGAWITFWIAAHDIGKVTPCFQLQVQDRASELKALLTARNFDVSIGGKHSHSDTGTKVFYDALLTGGEGVWQKLDRETAHKVAVTIGERAVLP